jgi:hypothetical protein
MATLRSDEALNRFSALISMERMKIAGSVASAIARSHTGWPLHVRTSEGHQGRALAFDSSECDHEELLVFILGVEYDP